MDDTHSKETRSTNIAATVKQIVKESLHLLDSKNVRLDLLIEQQTIVLPVSQALVRLVIGNVIRNGFIHCSDGDISVELNSKKLEMINATDEHDSSVQSENKGFGVGLSILGQTCKRLGWQHELSRIRNDGGSVEKVIATIRFA